MHYMQEHRKRPTCNRSGCKRTHERRGPWYCRPHERDALERLGRDKMETKLAEFRDCVEPDPETGCWLWRGGVNNEGYGMIQCGGAWLAHRFAFVAFLGGHQQGRQLDHLCNRILCVRPDHLWSVTAKVNSRLRTKRARGGNRPYWEDACLAPWNAQLCWWASVNGLPYGRPGMRIAEPASTAA